MIGPWKITVKETNHHTIDIMIVGIYEVNIYNRYIIIINVE